MSSEEVNLAVGLRVAVRNKLNEFGPGTIRFIGTTSLNTGIWVGIELDLPLGRNDGSVNNERFFTCAPGHGLLVRKMLVEALEVPPHEPPPPVPLIISRPVSPKTNTTTSSGAFITASMQNTPLKSKPSSTPVSSPTKLKEATRSLRLAELVRAQTVRIQTFAANHTKSRLKPQLDELAEMQRQIEAELFGLRLRNSELEKRSALLEKDVEVSAAQLHDVLVVNLNSEEKLRKEREALARDQKTVSDSKATIEGLRTQLAQRDSRLQELEKAQRTATSATDQLTIVELKKQHERQIEDIKKTYEDATAALRAQHAEELAKTTASSPSGTDNSRMDDVVEEQKKRIQYLTERRSRIINELLHIDEEECSSRRQIVAAKQPSSELEIV